MYGYRSWADRRVNPSLGRCLFSFVLIADTHVDREDQPSSSPFPVNALANARTRYCVEDIKGLGFEMGPLAPRFALHLGDLVHPVPSMPFYGAAADEFHGIVAELGMPLHVLPGNHDVGDKPVDWAPAGVVREEFLEKWEEHFGDQYQAFSAGGVRFVLINAQVINSGLELEGRQRAWLERELEDSANGRIMLFLHYPPYLCSPGEDESYDNLAEPGRSWILGLVEKYRVEALFAGHVHHFWYNRHASTDCYLLPSTSFTRQDYSEMFRSAPTPEMQDGRNDTEKVGYFVVLVYENGHVCHFRGTEGALLEKGQRLDQVRPVPRVIPFHPRELPQSPVGFDMRHPWAELVDIPPSGALDEFRRKRVRNDYPLLALWKMGIGLVRIPVEDLEDDRTVARIRGLREFGHEFVLISQGIPSFRASECMVMHGDLVKRWEVSLPMSRVGELSGAIGELKSKAGFPVYLSKLRMKSDVVRDGETYFHQISHGFSTTDEDEINALMSRGDCEGLFDGAVFRVARSDRAGEAVCGIADVCRRMGVQGSITMCMADQNPARHRCDDLDNARHIAEGMFTAAGRDGIELFIDTFMDLDRGHGVRNGVIDRWCNPRPAMSVVRNLCAIMSPVRGRSCRVDRGMLNDGRWISRGQGDEMLLLILPNSPSREFVLEGPVPEFRDGCHEAVDLVAGTVRPVEVRPGKEGGVLDFGSCVSGALLVWLSPGRQTNAP